ncbi:hypothetical protein BHE74_00033278, partial [Ensete ventricosum]
VELLLVLAEDQTTFFVHRDLATRIAIHTHAAFLAVQAVTHVITDHLVADVIDGVTACLRSGIGIAVLHTFLNLITRVTTTDRTRYSGELLAITATDLVAQQATGQCTDHGADDLMLILHRLLPGYGDVLADLARGFDLGFNRLHRQHLRILRAAFNQAVGGNSAPGSHTDSTQYRTNQQRLVHVNLLTITSGPKRPRYTQPWSKKKGTSSILVPFL